jgi:hypothetical protein
MPTYRFKNTETNEEFERFMSISARSNFLSENPHYQQMPVATNIVHEPGTNLKIDDGFREVLGRIKNTYKINKIKSY